MAVIHSWPDFDDLPWGHEANLSENEASVAWGQRRCWGQILWGRGQKIWPWGRVGLEDLTSLQISTWQCLYLSVCVCVSVSVVILRPRSRDSSALEFIFRRSRSWSRDQGIKVLVLVSSNYREGLELGLEFLGLCRNYNGWWMLDSDSGLHADENGH